MDSITFLEYKDFWVKEPSQHGSSSFSFLTQEEQSLYSNLKEHEWGDRVRLEQERINWSYAWRTIQALHNRFL